MTVKRVASEPRYLSYLRDTLAIKGVRRVVMHEALSNLRKIVFVQFEAGVARGAHGSSVRRRNLPKSTAPPTTASAPPTTCCTSIRGWSGTDISHGPKRLNPVTRRAHCWESDRWLNIPG